MAFDKATCNLLQKFVSDARKLLSDEFIQQLQNIYGLDPVMGSVAELSDLPALSPSEQQTASLLRDTLDHYLVSNHKSDPHQDKSVIIEALDRIVREQAFTVLNRLAALRMAEARQFVIESVSQGFQSKGFQLYQRISGSSLGEIGQSYQHYLFSVFDELSLDLAVLFNRYSSQGRLFPRETVLLQLLDLINHAELEILWGEDETIGWIYQYWNVRSEIDQARGESRAPRNSREMAVRNQFFTPRYVVEFLTDNTVGKTWYEMQQGQTSISEICDYLVIDEKAVFLQKDDKLTEEQAASDIPYVPYREAKDPRCLRVIDPACGSGHFLLYVFDLLIAIYEEAWEKEPENGWPLREKFEPLLQTYPNFEEYQKSIPALIISHNLYGIDIDPRAIQIAGLAVWLRGQRYWEEVGVKPVERPTIMRSNLICAEPLIIEQEQLSAYKSKLPIGQSNLLAELLNIIAEKMSLAGEMGILLKLEKDIRQALEQVEKEFKRYQESEIQDDLFGREHIDKMLNLSFSVQGLNSSFFAGAEKQLMKALSGFVNSSSSTTAFKNKLFADDIEHSLAFIDLMKLKFDVIVMNPPFGKPSVDSESYMEVNYPDCPTDVYQAFVSRAQELLIPLGFLGSISSRTGFFLKSYESWRSRVLLRKFRPLFIADFGGGVLDAMVETAAYVLRSTSGVEDLANRREILEQLIGVELSKSGDFSLPRFQKCRLEKLSREQALSELASLEEAGFITIDNESNFKARKCDSVIRAGLTEINEYHQYPKMLCFRLVDEKDKGHKLYEAITGKDLSSVLITNPSSFDAIPGSPFSYWVSDNLRSVFNKYPQFKSDCRSARQGLASGDDFRFARMWWEVSLENISPVQSHNFEVGGAYCELEHKWQTFAKGGKTTPYYLDIQMVCNWAYDGLEMRAFERSVIRNSDYYYRSGFSWPLRALRYTPSVLPKGTVFSVRSMSAFSFNEPIEKYLVLGNSSVFDSIFKLKLGKAHTPEFQVGVANVLPVPLSEMDAEENKLVGIFLKLYHLLSYGSQHNEVSRLYSGCWYSALGSHSLSESVSAYITLHEETECKIKNFQDCIDQKVLDYYNLVESDLPDGGLQNNWSTITGLPVEQDNARSFIAKDLLSNIFGRLVGRFWQTSVGMGKRDPFDPLPVPQINQDLKCLPLKDGQLKKLLMKGIVPIGQYFIVSADNVLPDILTELYSDNTGLLDELLAELNSESLSQYYTKPTAFFDYHLSQYSGSSRIAPVYLPLTSTAGNFTVWLFYQKLNRATLFTVLNDVVDPAVNTIEEQLSQVKGSNLADEAKLSSLLDEIKDFRDSIQEVLSTGFNCDIDDGVVITAAPLRNLFNHSSWCQELDDKWAGLEAGDYDWSKLAFNYWPERVLKKCQEDRSIAIAHGLETELWEYVEAPAARGNGTKWVWQAKEMTQVELEVYIEDKKVIR
ncbi:DNA methyltransferase [uncultured Cocleimonas sp.]|uniref:Eco57I restriction-modification methylase domain-containing protein n=1 Tax=uncultured Cocleimonas sp. TaxID=1051587 RepID=UPI00262DDAB6|nr:DNA methyltransferase [uncultured Cocleimonas sp.]